MIGLDGATFRVIDPMMGRELLPCIGSLVEKGSRANLESTIPPATIPAIPSFMTGKNPGKHGVFDFFVRGRNGKPRLASSRSVAGKNLWQILDENGKTSVVLNLPLTYPPDPIKGAIVSGMLSPLEGYTYPESVEHELVGLGYVKDIGTDLLTKKWNKPVLLDALKGMAEKRTEATAWLMERYDWDLLIAYFRGSDELQHVRWSDKKALEEYYNHLDSLLEGIIRRAGNDVDTIIWSDHGFGPLDYYFHVNKWLVEKGYACLRKRRTINSERKKISASIGLTQGRIRRVLEALHIETVLDIVPDVLKDVLPPTDLELDPTKSKAFFASTVTGETQSVNMNLADREPDGIVKPEEYPALRTKIALELKETYNPLNGARVIERVLMREEAYHGPFVDQAPDLIVVPSKGYKLVNYYLPRAPIRKARQPRGRHETDGIFVASGPSFKKGVVSDARIYDLAPTVLYLMGLPIPESMDGKVLFEALRES